MLVIKRDGERHIDFYYDDDLFCSVNHDEHGWAGMEAVEDALVELATRAGLSIFEWDDENDESE